MKTLILFFMFVVTAVSAQDHAHSDHHKKESGSVKVKKGEQFTATPDLKVRMEKVTILVKELKSKSKDKKAAGEYGLKIAAVVDDIFKTCKLEPKADAAIHPILGKIYEGTEELKKGNQEKGSATIHQALEEYGATFK